MESDKKIIIFIVMFMIIFVIVAALFLGTSRLRGPYHITIISMEKTVTDDYLVFNVTSIAGEDHSFGDFELVLSNDINTHSWRMYYLVTVIEPLPDTISIIDTDTNNQLSVGDKLYLPTDVASDYTRIEILNISQNFIVFDDDL